MKNQYSFFILCCILSASLLSVSAQQAITQAQFPYDIKNTIVKEYVFPATVSYVETSVSHYFAYADASMTVQYHNIGKKIFVKDFKIHNDSVYFCGYDNTNGCRGVWGSFSVLDLQTNVLPYNIYDGFVCGNQYVDTLHSIVVYNLQGKLHIVTVGTTTDGITLKNSCTIDITQSTGGIYAWNYTIGVTPNYSGELIRYVCATDNLIVTAGYYANAPNIESYRVHLKSNLFSVGGPQDIINYFAFSTWVAYTRNPFKFAITHMYGDIMAMALQAINLNYTPPYDKFILFYEYDMSTLANGVNTTINSLAVFTDQYSLDVEGLVYSTNNNILSILVKGNLPYSPLYGNGSIVAEITPGAATAKLHGLKDVELHSIDNYNSQNNFVCLGADMNNFTNAKFYTQPLNIDIPCTEKMQIGGLNPSFSTKQDQCPYTIYSDSFNYDKRQSTAYKQTPNDIICQ